MLSPDDTIGVSRPGGLNAGCGIDRRRDGIADLTGQIPNDYPVFGQVVRGLDVAQTISNGAVTANSSGEQSKPVDPAMVLQVMIQSSAAGSTAVGPVITAPTQTPVPAQPTATSAPVYISSIWERFIPHFCKPGKTEGRIVGIPDAGMHIKVGGCTITALPAHFLHAEGNFHFWDPASGILFSGDLGVTLGGDPRKPISRLADALPLMEPFHRRYMASGRILKLWAQMAAQLPIRMLVPQHGAPLIGDAVPAFIEWVKTLECGVDRMSQADYRMP
mgnify:CR=1 FL=1